MHIYDEIKSHFILPNAYKDWTDYRNTLTGYLLSQTDEVALPLSFCANMKQSSLLPTLAIIGAGACNDLDLARIIPYFSTVTLIDRDASAMQKALAVYHLEDNPAVRILPVSLNGITDSDCRRFCEELQAFIHQNYAAFTSIQWETFALSQLDILLEKSRQSAYQPAPAAYDYIWCFGVHSQLLAMPSYLYHVFTLNLQNSVFTDIPISEEAFSLRLKKENAFFIPRFHDALLAGAKKAVFIGCEQKRLDSDSTIEGAYQAIHDIRSRNLSLNEYIILWNFCPVREISYEMLIQKITL